jgi:ATP-dependent helicase/nuclease subunit A
LRLTEDQSRAVRAPGSVAVVAGAGTGKTHMLAERYAHHLLEDGLSPLEVVAVTFTELAADELRSRIRGRVREALADPEEALAELEAAQISTIHALCARICREHPEEAEVTPDFGILDEVGSLAWTADKLQDAVDQLPEKHFLALPYSLMQDVLEALLSDPIAADRALGVGPESWEELACRARKEALKEFLEDPVVSECRQTLSFYQGAPGDLMEEARAGALTSLEELYSDDEVSEALEALCGISLKGGGKKRWGEGKLETVKDALKALRDRARVERRHGIVTLKLGPADERLKEVLPVVREAFKGAGAFISEAKRRSRILDFSDLEVHALKALEHEEVREYYQRRWQAFLVDEFQDTNPVQAVLLDLLTEDEDAALTIVGDEKQSIYGFRRADVAVFRRFRDRILARGGSEVILSRTFRSHTGLVGKVNAVFSSVLGDLHQNLEADRTEAPHEPPHLQAYAMEAGGKVGKAQLQRAEAALIARMVREMVDRGLPVYEPISGGLRAVRSGDIAILSRTWAPLELYGEALAAADVPTVHVGGGNLLETREAKDGYALLRFLADPDDDLALIALLRSPFFAIDDRTLHELALDRDKKHSWWSVVREESSGEKLALARTALRDLLRRRRFERPEELVRRADRMSAYTAVIANLPGAPRREADWRGFCSLVRELGWGTESVFSVARSLRRLYEDETEIPRPPLEAKDAVGLMTIHAAKGLEWPLVIVPDLARGFPSSSDPVLFESELGVAVADFGGGEDEGESVLYRVIANRKARGREAESRRLLYVAATRARDHLVLTSTEGHTKKLCGLTLLLPGLELAGVECVPEPFDPEDARPPDLPAPIPDAPIQLLLEPVR